MTALAHGTDQYLRLFEQAEARENGSARPLLRKLRQSAIARFRELGFPAARNEDWKFTSVAPLLQVPFVAAEQAMPAPAGLPPLLSADAVRLVFVAGRFAPEHSHMAGAGHGIRVANLAALTDEQLKPHLAQLADLKDAAFTALNTAFMRDGAAIEVADNVAASQPLEVIHVGVSAERPMLAHPRCLIVAGKHAKITVVERFIAVGADLPYFTNAVTEIAVREGAHVDHYKVQQEGPQAFHVANTQVVLQRASKFATHYLALGGHWVRNEVRVRFDDEGAEATVNGLYLAGGTQHVDNFTVIDHARAHCASHELYKGILTEQAHGVFNGKILVRPAAQKTDAKQTNKVLLLSDHATINTKPQLEIFADDVKCTHGATIGQLDDEALFYLRARGIGLDQARSLLTYAFANDIIGRIQVEALRQELERFFINFKPLAA